MLCVSVVVSGDFCCFKLALPSLLSMSFDMIVLIKIARLDSTTVYRPPGLPQFARVGEPEF